MVSRATYSLLCRAHAVLSRAALRCASSLQVQLNRPLANLEPKSYARIAGLGETYSVVSGGVV